MNPRILMVTPRYYPYLGGLERQAHTLSKKLVRRGLDVTVVTGNDNLDLPGTEQVDGIRIHRLTSSASSLLRGLSFVPLLTKFLLINAHKYDLIHLHTFGWYLLGIISTAKILRIPVLLKLPNVGDFGLPGIRKRRFGRLLLRLVKCADAFIAMSQNSKQELLEEGIAPSRILEINNGIDTAIFQPPASEQEKVELRKKLSLPSGMLCLFSGRLSKEKGLHDLFAVWPRLLQTHADTHLILCGSGPQESELRELSHSLGIENNVHFMGSVDDIITFYKAADLSVLPSYFEGNSNSILEAMASGLPIVSTRVGGTPLLMGQAGKDYLVEPGDQTALLDALLRLLRSEQAKQRLAGDLLSRARQEFAIAKIADDYINGYKFMNSERLIRTAVRA